MTYWVIFQKNVEFISSVGRELTSFNTDFWDHLQYMLHIFLQNKNSYNKDKKCVQLKGR